MNCRFISQYRLPQALALQLIDEIRPFAENNGDIPLEIQILVVLNFFASGSYQLCVLTIGQANHFIIHYHTIYFFDV